MIGLSLRAVVVISAVLVAGCKGASDAPKAQTVDPAELRPGPIRHATLSPELVARITKVQAVFAEVDPTPLEKWLEDFRRDVHPERELAIYESMARAYSGYVAGRELTMPAKNDVYVLVLLRSSAPDDQVLANARLTTLSMEEARAVLRLYDASPQPVTVSPSK